MFIVRMATANGRYGLTIKAHSSGPDVESGRCPYLGCFVSLSDDAIAF